MWGYLRGFDTDLFSQLERIRDEMDAAFGSRSGMSGIRSVAAGTFPAINIGHRQVGWMSMCLLRASIRRVSTSRSSRTC